MEQGMDPEIRQLFVKILNSIAWLLLWLMSAIALGIHFQWAMWNEVALWKSILFYILLFTSLGFLIRYWVRLWR